MVFSLLSHTIFPLLRLIFVREVRGLENLPKQGSFIVVSNHASYADVPLLVSVLVPYLKRNIHFVVWKRLARIFVFRWLVRYFGGVFENGSIDPLVLLLQAGKIVGIYPEGGRTHMGKIRKVTHAGLGIMAAQTKVPVIPIRSIGIFELWPYNQRFPKIKKSVAFHIGKPLYYKGKKTRKEYLAFANRVMHVIQGL